MQKILYLMHVPWGWIKQRPHFLAECLNEYFEVAVYHNKAYRVSRLVENNAGNGVRVHELFALPFVRFNFIHSLNKALTKYQLANENAGYPIVWVTSPAHYEALRGILPGGTILIYDCMDDVLEFPGIKANPRMVERLRANEQELLLRSDIVLASSRNLKRRLGERYDLRSEPLIVNNAIALPRDGEPSPPEAVLPEGVRGALSGGGGKKIVYIGTVSEWIDFPLIMESLERFPDIRYVFVGPLEVSPPVHERIICTGPIPHGYVITVMEQADLLVMPFVLNRLVTAINPVKIYEYIYSGKPSIAVGYEETEVFADYTYLYSDRDHYLALIGRLVGNGLPARKGCAECREFVQGNTWQGRAGEIRNRIREVLGRNGN